MTALVCVMRNKLSLCLATFCFFIIVIWCGLLGFYASDLHRRWREPVLRYPVLVIESDDWGAGPLEQAQALDALHQVLQGHRDQTGVIR